MALFVAVLTFIVVGCVIFAGWLAMGGGAEQDIIQQRLETVRQTERQVSVSHDVELLRDETLSTVPVLNQLLMKWTWAGLLRKYIHQAGLSINPAKVLLTMAVLGLTAYLATGFLYHIEVLAIIAGIAATLSPLGFILWKRNKRLDDFEEHLPEALDLLGRAVRTGHSFSTSLELIAQECTEPISGEFRTTFEEQKLGLPLRESLLNLAMRVPIVDVQLLVTALLIQRDSGGNLAEILDELSRVIRERFRIYRDVKVKTAQGRLTAAILIAMPLIMLAAMELLNPTYVHILFVDPTGTTMLMIAAGMQILGSLLLWKIVNISV